MSNEAEILALDAEVKRICAKLGCRAVFVTYFDGGPSEGPAIQTVLGAHSDHDAAVIIETCFYFLDKACNYK